MCGVLVRKFPVTAMSINMTTNRPGRPATGRRIQPTTTTGRAELRAIRAELRSIRTLKDRRAELLRRRDAIAPYPPKAEQVNQ